jgi:hypothetical protein
MPEVIGGFVAGFAGTAPLVLTGAGAAASAFGAAAAVGSIVATGVLIGGSAFLLAGNTPGVSAAKEQAAQAAGTFRQSTPIQRVVYGRQRAGGAVFFLDDTKPPYLYLGVLVSARKARLRNVYIGGILVAFDASGNATTEPYYNGVKSFVKFSWRDGDPGQAIDPLLAADFPNLDASFRQRGIATAVFRFDFGADYEEHQALWGNVQVPTVALDVEGAPVYDPRDATQDVDDETTWKFSANAALIEADLLRQPYGGRFQSSEIDWTRIAAAATYDDGLVGLKDGTFQHRYEIGGVASLDQSPYDLIGGMLACNRAALVQHQGEVWIDPADPLTPAMTIDDRLIAGGFNFQAAPATKSLLNRVRCRFVAPDREYQLADGPILDRTDLQSDDGELLEATLDYAWVQTHQRAQRLNKAHLLESREGAAITGLPLRLTHRTLALKAGMVVTVDSRLYPQMNGDYRVENSGFSDDFTTVTVTLAGYDATIEGNWHAETDEQDFTLADLDVS